MDRQYIVHDEHDALAAYSERLAEFNHYKFKEIPYYSFSVPEEKEASLLELLSSIPELTFREAVERNALDDGK